MKRWVESSVVVRAKLNAFQRIMRLWDQVHPYNAVQAFRMSGSPDVERIGKAWRATLKALRLGWVVVDDDYFYHLTLNDSDERGQLIPTEVAMSFDQLLSREMNVEFGVQVACPFRAFVHSDSPDSHCIGLTYLHWTADSASIRRILHEWYLRIVDPTSKGTARPLRIPGEGIWKLFGPNRAGWNLDEAILGLLRYRTRFCRARRNVNPMTDCTVSVCLHTLPDGLGPKLVQFARRQKVKLNDVFLAAIAQAVHELGANPVTPGRDELAVGTIADLRRSADRKMEDIFGLFLGFTTTILRPTDLNNWPRLLQSVARQNAWHKKTFAPHASVLRMAVGLAEAKLVSPRRWCELYRSRLPIAAGISNVNMSRDWAGLYHPHSVLDYYRVAPSGPLTPIVFTPTTLGQRLNFLITRQNALIAPRQSQQIADRIGNRLIQLAENDRS